MAAAAVGAGGAGAPKAAMPMQTLGLTGLLVSRLSFGSWVTFANQVGDGDAFTLMKTAYEHGVNLFDNAEAYAKGESETIMGSVVKRGEAEGVWKREDLVLTTKIFFGTRAGVNNKGLSRKHVVEGLAASLARMQLTYVDVVYAHRPDPVTPMEEVVRAFNHVIEKGQAFYWGTSEWSAAQIADAVGIAARLGLIGPCVEQPEYNLFARTRVEAEYEPLYELCGLGLTTWSPLASGVLTGKYSGHAVPEGSRLALPGYAFIKDAKFGEGAWQIDAADELVPIAAEIGCSRAQLALAWCLRNPRVSSVIMGATTAAQLLENLSALAVLEKLTPERVAAMEAVGGGKGKPLFHRSFSQSHSVRETTKISNFAHFF